MAAFEGFAAQQDGRRSSCCLQQEVAEQDQVVGSGHVHPIAGLEGHLWCRQADRLAGVRPVAAAHLLGWAVRW